MSHWYIGRSLLLVVWTGPWWNALTQILAFQPLPTTRLISKTRLFEEKSNSPLDSLSPEDLFSSEGWPVVKKQLNELPAFACADAEGQALLFDLDIGGQRRSVPMYFMDVDAARDELLASKKRQKEDNASNVDYESFDILPYPLGEVFEDASLGHAVLLPSVPALVAAGAPEGVNALGQQVPLFACMSVVVESDDDEGSPVLPLFMDPNEARAAIDEALQTDALGGFNGENAVGAPGRPTDLTLDCMSLTKAVKMLTTIPETPAFQFVPPESSIRHIQQYLEDTSRDNKGTLGFQ